MTDIPLATILRINAARTIPLARYEEEGNFDRFGYIKDLAENHGADLPAVIEIADLLGPDEDFDGLVTTIEDAAEGFGFGALILGGREHGPGAYDARADCGYLRRPRQGHSPLARPL
ncbi:MULTISPECIES: hypothetical protein [Sphingobium]|jgi:hypothetical protein|uniref:hypothetical protein n=1 Tax=Sphingobium TaxID=165695 RepID=UPI001E5A5874|nr:hypothetical protein [Sphingobium xenophagum]